MSFNEKRVIIAEDEALVAMDLSMQLEDLGILVEGIASSGKEAIRLAKDSIPDLVIMDIRLQGGTNGFEAAKTIYQRQRIPVLFITASSKKELAWESDSYEFNILSKPFSRDQLRNALEISFKMNS